MSPTEFFIRRPVTTILINLSLLLFGIVSYFYLPSSDLPSVDFPVITVTATLPGASPETMAASVATPLEKEFTDISGIENMVSSSSTSYTSITIQFSLDRNIDAAAQDVQAAISKAELPPNLPRPPMYSKTNAAASPVIWLCLSSSTMPISKVSEYAKTFVSRRISMTPGVSQVQSFAEQKYAVRVQLDPKALTSRGISLAEVGQAVARENQNLPTGSIKGDYSTMNIQAQGQLLNAREYQSIVVRFKDNKSVRLEELGHVVDGVDQDKVGAWWKGKRSIILGVKRQPGANTIRVVDSIREMLPSITAQLPASVRLEVLYDQSISIRDSLHDVKFTLCMAIALVILVVFVSLRNLTATLITSVAVPVSLVGTFAVMYLLGYSLDNLSLMALTLSVGFVVDDAIVMLENVVRHMEMGKTPWQATLDGAREIGFTIISITMSLVVVFLPVVLMPGILGRILKEFSVTISVAILISGFVSLSLTPMLAGRMLRPSARARERAGDKTKVLEAAGPGFLQRIYGRMLESALNYRSLTLLAFAAMLVFTGYLFTVVPSGFIPSEDRGIIVAYAQAEEGVSFESMAARMDKVSGIFSQHPGVEGVCSITPTGTQNSGLFLIRFKDHPRQSAEEIMTQLRPLAVRVPGIEVFLVNPPPIPLDVSSSKGAYQYALQAVESSDLYPAALRLIEKMKTLPQVRDVSSDLQVSDPQIDIRIERERAAALGISAEQIESTLAFAYSDQEISKILAPTDQYKVILEVDPAYQKDPRDLSLLYIGSKTGKLVPLRQLTSVRHKLGPLQVNHLFQLPSVAISFNIPPGVSLGEATGAIQHLAGATLPATVKGNFQGTAQEFEKSMKSLYLLLLLAFAVIYLILGILYESFIHPVTILAGLPSAGLGALITLLLFRSELNLYAFVGIIMLIGIVKKNAIMMIEFAVEARKEHGLTPREAITRGALVRFRPIMMTTVAAFAGVFPIAYGYGAGGEARQALGLSVCGGLMVSQFITLLITPVIYVQFEQLRARLKGQPGGAVKESAIQARPAL